MHVKSLKTDVVTVGAARLADFEKTLATYLRCADCESNTRLERQGVPLISCGCSFGAFILDNDEEREHLEKCKKWANKPRGFALLRGNVGTGKTFLAVAILLHHKGGRFVPHSKFLEYIVVAMLQSLTNRR